MTTIKLKDYAVIEIDSIGNHTLYLFNDYKDKKGNTKTTKKLIGYYKNIPSAINSIVTRGLIVDLNEILTLNQYYDKLVELNEKVKKDLEEVVNEKGMKFKREVTK